MFQATAVLNQSEPDANGSEDKLSEQGLISCLRAESEQEMPSW